MRKIVLFILFSLLLWGCEKKYDNVIDSISSNYQVTSISHHSNYDLKIPADSLLVVRINFSSQSELSKVYFDIIASNNSVLNSSPVELLPLGNNIFQNSFVLKRTFPIGTYHLNFSVTGLDGKTKLVATSSFEFNNGQDNVAPVISNDIIEPDTLNVTDTTVIFTSIEVNDLNGAGDIAEVYYIVHKPDNSTNRLFLYDDGSCCPLPPNDVVSGDSVANDGIYSRVIQVDQSNQKGTYIFEFQAKDRSDSLSNIINHSVLIQ